MTLLELRNVTSGYGTRTVLEDVTFVIDPGEIILLVGPNGSGKSTLLRTIYGLTDLHQSPERMGRIYFDGEEITRFKPSQLLNRGLLFIPQTNKTFDNLTVNENLRVSSLALGDSALFRERYEEVGRTLPMLRELKNRKPINMSGGEIQFLALGMALIHRPKMILMDEPLGALSSQSIEIVKAIISQLHLQQGITFLIAEHMVSEALELTSRLIALESGQIIRDIRVDEVFDKESLIPLLF